MIKKIFQRLSLFATFAFSLLLPGFIFALPAFPGRIPGGAIDWLSYLESLVHNIFSFIWILFGSFAFGSFIYAGYLFLNARGDMNKVKDARQALIWGVVGVAVGLLAFAIPFIVSALLGV